MLCSSKAASPGVPTLQLLFSRLLAGIQHRLAAPHALLLVLPPRRWAYLPYSMHMAGPREAIQHMIIRKVGMREPCC